MELRFFQETWNSRTKAYTRVRNTSYGTYIGEWKHTTAFYELK